RGHVLLNAGPGQHKNAPPSGRRGSRIAAETMTGDPARAARALPVAEREPAALLVSAVEVLVSRAAPSFVASAVEVPASRAASAHVAGAAAAFLMSAAAGLV